MTLNLPSVEEIDAQMNELKGASEARIQEINAQSAEMVKEETKELRERSKEIKDKINEAAKKDRKAERTLLKEQLAPLVKLRNIVAPPVTESLALEEDPTDATEEAEVTEPDV